MVKHVRELRDEFGVSRSKTCDLKMEEYVIRMERILHTLSEEGRERLDNRLIDKFCVSETERRELCMNDFRDAMRLIVAVGLQKMEYEPEQVRYGQQYGGLFWLRTWIEEGLVDTSNIQAQAGLSVAGYSD